MSVTEREIAFAESERSDSRRGNVLRNIAAILPFGLWIGLMVAWQHVPEKTAFKYGAHAYAFRAAAATIAALAMWRLPQVYGSFSFSRNLRWVPYGLFAGALMAFVWMAPEMGFLPDEAAAFYRTWFTGAPGFDPGPYVAEPSPYDPAVCGVALTYARLAGSAVVIAVAEEIFFRSFLYRWLQGRHFADVPERRFEFSAFALTVFLFAIEHDRWFVGAIAGIVYGLLAIYGGISAAITAHATTNFIIGWTVIHSVPFDKWGFW